MAVVVSGTTLKRRVVGEVDEFCPICREAKQCDLVRVGAAAHLYWISFGRGSFVGHEARCPDCGVRWAVKKEDPEREALVAGRDALEQRRAAGTLTPEERQALLEEPFDVVEPMLQEQKRARRMHPRGLVAAALAFPAMLLLPRLEDGLLPRPVEIALGLLCVATFFYAAWYILGPVRWYRVEIVEPALVRALRPLEPSREELEATLRNLKLRGRLVAKTVKPARLYGLLEAAPA